MILSRLCCQGVKVLMVFMLSVAIVIYLVDDIKGQRSKLIQIYRTSTINKLQIPNSSALFLASSSSCFYQQFNSQQVFPPQWIQQKFKTFISLVKLRFLKRCLCCINKTLYSYNGDCNVESLFKQIEQMSAFFE